MLTKEKCTLNARGVENSFLPCKKSNATQQENRFFILTPAKRPDLKENYVDVDQKSHFHCRGLVKTRFFVLKTLEVLKIEKYVIFSWRGAKQKYAELGREWQIRT